MTDTLLTVESLDVRYHTEQGVLPALHEIALSVARGEIVGVVGESGCGKSSLALALLRLLPPNGEITGGRVTLGGRELLRLSGEQMRHVRGGEAAMIFQDPMTSLNPTFRVGTQIVEALRSHRNARPGGKADLRRRAIEALEQVGIPDAAERIDDYPHEFSGGQRQRMMIAMALLLQPSLLIADEPTSALDVTLEAQILELLRRLREEHGTAILFISHDLGVVAQICERVVVMYAGRVIEEGDVVSLFERPRHPYTQALLASVPSRGHRGGQLATIPGRVPSLSALPPGCKFADRCRFVRSVCREDEPALRDGVRCYLYEPSLSEAWAGRNGPAETAAAVVVRDREAASPAPPGPAAGSLVELRRVRTYFFDRASTLARIAGSKRGAVQAVDDVHLEIRRGEVLGLVGESGSGKTTLAETILRLTPATMGEILFEGRDVRRMRRRELRRLRRRAQMIFQDPYSSLSPRQRVSALLAEPYAINRVPKAQRRTPSELLEMVSLSPELLRKYPNQLSGGQARRVGIARALALHPEFLIADEPAAGLDVSAAAAVLNLMRDLREQLGLTYLIITHNLNLVSYMADRIAVMYLGRIVELGPTERILESPAHPYTRALLSVAPELDPHTRRQHRLLIPGEIPSPKNPPPGCRFHTRCAFAEQRSREEVPELEEIEEGHFVACHFWRKVREQDDVSVKQLVETRRQ